MAYKRQTRAFAAWLTERAAEHPDAFDNVVGAEAAATAWRRHLVGDRAKPATVNQALAAVTLMYEQAGKRIVVKRARVPRPGEPDALTAAEQGAVERAAARRGVRDAAILAVLLYAGARVEECGRLEFEDVAVTARTGTVRLQGKGDEVRTVPLPANARLRLTDWLDQRRREPDPLWIGQRGALTNSGITQVVLAAGIEGLRPHRLRHTFATRLRRRRRLCPDSGPPRPRLPGHQRPVLPRRPRRDRRRRRARLRPVDVLLYLAAGTTFGEHRLAGRPGQRVAQAYSWQRSSLSGSFTPGGAVPIQGNAGGTDQSRAPLKSTWPPENLAQPKLTLPPKNSARKKLIWPPEIPAPRKSIWPPENLAPLKSPPSKTTPVKSKSRSCQDTAVPSLRCAVMTRMTV